MKINVTENKVSIKEEQILNENEYNIHKIQFDFSSEYTDDLVKVALFSIDNHTYKKIISNNECDIPPEVLTKRGYSILGVYAYKTEQDTLVLRYSPSPTRISVYDGSYKAEAENSEPITPSEIEQYQQILQNSLQQFQNQYNVLVEETEGDIQAIENELQRKVDEGYFDGEDGYTPQKGIDYFTQEDIEEIENDVKSDLQETVLVNYSLIAETGSKIELSINTTDYKLTAILKDKNNNIMHTSNVIDLPLETMVVNATYDNTTKKIILTLQNGTTVEFSIADLVSGLVSESQLQTILANYYTQTEINNLLANKVDKVTGKGLSTNDFTDAYKNNVDSNTNSRHTHSNKDTLDSITSADINNWNNKANMSDIPDTSNFITNAVNNLINYYLKSEIYTKTEVTNLISAIEKATFEIVNELPATGQSNVIYLVPSANPKTQNIKDEYIWLNNAWEQIGNTQVDLTGYATEAWVNTQISGFLTQVQEAIDTFGGYSGLLNTTELNDNKIKIDKVSFNSIFVATTGNDATGNGSYNKPYKTITYAISKAIAGQTIYVRGGTYKENIVFNKSGEEDKYIVLRNYPAETAVVDCTGKTVEAVVDFNYNSYIRVIGLELCNLTQKSNAVFGVLARGGESNLVIANLNIHNIKGKSASKGHANGIKIVGLDETKPCQNILIQNNHIYDCTCGLSEALTVTANSQYIDIIGNKVHDNGNIGIDIAGNFGDCSTASLDFARYVYVAENEVYNCNSGNADCAGIYCDGASNVIFARNKSYNNQVGLEIGSEEMPTNEAWLPHNNLAINNLIYNNSVRQVGLGGYSTEAGKTFNTLLWNNTIIHPSNGTDVALSMNAGENYSIVNNIIISLGTWNYLINSDLDTTYVKNFLFYNNLLYHANAQWMDAYLNIAGTEYHTETFQNADFTENNIITDSYGLNADYTLAVDSPCIGAGYFADKILEFLDLAGNKRTETIDIGCYKYI